MARYNIFAIFDKLWKTECWAVLVPLFTSLLLPSQRSVALRGGTTPWGRPGWTTPACSAPASTLWVWAAVRRRLTPGWCWLSVCVSASTLCVCVCMCVCTHVQSAWFPLQICLSHLSIYVSIYLSACLFITFLSLSISLFIYLLVNRSICLSVGLSLSSVNPPVSCYLSIYLSIGLSVWPWLSSVYPSLSISICLSVCLSFWLAIAFLCPSISFLNIYPSVRLSFCLPLLHDLSSTHGSDPAPPPQGTPASGLPRGMWGARGSGYVQSVPGAGGRPPSALHPWGEPPAGPQPWGPKAGGVASRHSPVSPRDGHFYGQSFSMMYSAWSGTFSH